MTYSWTKDLWGRFHVTSDAAPKATRPDDIAGVVHMDHPSAFDHTVALVRDEALARLVASTANYRGRSAAEWLELRAALEAVPQDEEWQSRVEDFGSRGLIVNYSREWVATVFKADQSNIESECRFIENVREHAARLLRESVSELFDTLESADGVHEITVRRADLAYLAPHCLLSVHRGRVYSQHGADMLTLLWKCEHGCELGLCERVEPADGNPCHLYPENLERREDRRRVVLDVPAHVAAQLGHHPSEKVTELLQ